MAQFSCQFLHHARHPGHCGPVRQERAIVINFLIYVKENGTHENNWNRPWY